VLTDIESVTTGDPLLQKVKDDAKRWFNAIKEKSTANGIRLRSGLVISPTEIEDTILDYAESENVDIIVIGGGKSGLKARLHGSTSSHIATQSKRSVLIVK
jgi:nucleotide-binding universal stress UspA family protein